MKINESIKELSQKTLDTSVATAKEMTQIRKNSDNSLTMFASMKTSLETIALANKNQANTNPTSQPTQTPAPSSPNPRLRKGIMFSSSIGLGLDAKRFMQELNCEVKIIPTYYIEEHSGATDPDAFLQCMVNQHAKQGFDFAIIATGSNDITMMDTENAPATTIFQQAKEQSELLCDIAKNMSTELNLDLFIMEKPPRYDQPAKDPSGMKQKLSRYSNGVLATTTGLVPRTFLVEQAGLSRKQVNSTK